MVRILVVGGHGMLGRPVVRNFVNAGYTVSLFARNPDQVKTIFPDQVRIFCGNLEDKDSIAAATENIDALYINLSTQRPGGDFQPELDGTANILDVIRDRKDIAVAKISALGAEYTDGWWNDADNKYLTEDIIVRSGHPFLICRPTWFMESIPLFLRGRRYIVLGKDANRMYWIAGDDYGRQVAKAIGSETCMNRVLNFQGTEGLTFREAAERFLAIVRPDTAIRRIPLFMLKPAALFSGRIDSLVKLITYYQARPEELKSEDTWELLGKPEMKIEDFARNILNQTIDPAADSPSERQ